VVGALFETVPALGNVALVCLLFYFVFAILGTNLLAVGGSGPSRAPWPKALS
jgi:hypothetical protein